MTLPRRVIINTNAYGVDDKNIVANQTISRSTTQTLILNNTDVVKLSPFVIGWGGECRFELKLALQVLSDKTQVRLFGEALLFEGTSEKTSDLDGKLVIDEIIPSTKTGNIKIQKRVNNTDEGGDYVDFNFVVDNITVPVD
ncbi:hypothetical protein Cylst_0766 [Cylindrospermum stagnale PCC 7417]|uniref:Uncharacterized protein n=1 Tax=Cylindrospermum stagnale PCC 7417 TaxID=56107 RepID=K9WSC8_9NOST|nr:hypothetical protein [Cylindrospermum stagnale]AFZ23093.1 hypothetical protein Cylst_0766 [Cylindrospermum stagnale PCC 7417]